ncbi:MAG: hypothetical protein ACXU9F_08810 [Syntrophales bacterium]
MNLDDEGSAQKLPQPVACPLTILYSLTWKDSSFCVVTIATQSLEKSLLFDPFGGIIFIRNVNIGEENGYEGFRKNEGLRA